MIVYLVAKLRSLNCFYDVDDIVISQLVHVYSYVCICRSGEGIGCD